MAAVRKLWAFVEILFSICAVAFFVWALLIVILRVLGL